ncbi:MAG: nitrous oxide reductase family maturation protein NosD [Candidatus Hermodarchaeota archaeon]
MKVKSKKNGILLIIWLIFPLILISRFNSSYDYKTFIDNPQASGEYVVDFIHIDGANPGNWSATTGYDWCSGNGTWSNPYKIENVTIDAINSPTRSGILIENSKNKYFIIKNCTVYNSGVGSYDAGIRLDNTCNGTIINNICSNNGRNGITLYINCENNTISGNTVNYNAQNGIFLYQYCDNNNLTGNKGSDNNFGIQLFDNCHYNNITGNTLNNNRIHGLRLDYCDNNQIKGNTANYNGENGIYVYYSEWNNITGNLVNFNRLIGIHLRYFCMNNVIKDNKINSNDLGIFLQTTFFTNVTYNSLNGNNYCIYEQSSSSNIISNNDCSSPTVQTPIAIDGDATGVGAHNWTWAESQTWCSGSGTWEDPFIIQDLIISGFGFVYYGIEIRDSNVFFEIRNCKIYNADDYGIYFEFVNNSLLINNNCSNNEYGGIALTYKCYNNTLSGNTVNNNGDYGIYFYEENSNNTVIENTANQNGEVGISLHWYSNSTIIRENIANNNGLYGIELYDYCGYNKILDNTINNNGERGINIEYEGSYNMISNNQIENNGLFGIYLESYCIKNNFTENTINNNSKGIYLDSGCDSNIISGNIISDNIQFGIYLAGDGEGTGNNFNLIIENLITQNNAGVFIDSNSYNNSIYENLFITNLKHAIDNGVDNKWNSSTIGNFWDNHTSPDNNKDGIVDTPYTYIGGSAGSIDYLPIAPKPPGGLDPAVIAVIVVVSVIGGLVIIGVILKLLVNKGKISLEKLKDFSFKRKKLTEK